MSPSPSLTTPPALALRLALVAETLARLRLHPSVLALRRTGRTVSAAAVRFGLVRADPASLSSAAASRHRHRSDGTTYARPSRSLVVSSHLESAPLGSARARTFPPRSTSPCGSSFPRISVRVRARRSLLRLPKERATLFARRQQNPHLACRLSPFGSAGARFVPFPLARSGLSTDTGAPRGLPRPMRQERQFAVRFSPFGRLTPTPLPACAFRLVAAPMLPSAPKSFGPFRRPAPPRSPLALPRADLRRRMGQASVRSFPTTLASSASTALSRARVHAPLLGATRLFELSDSSDSPGPFSRSLWA